MKYRIRDLRKARGLTLEQLADLVGTSAGYLSDIETGKRGVSIPMLSAIAEGLKVKHLVNLYSPETDAEREMMDHLEIFLLLSPDDQKAVARHARGLLPDQGGK